MKRIGSWLAVAALVASPGCGDVLGGDDGRVTVLLKDAPGDVVKAVVTISSIYLVGGESDGEQADGGKSEGGRVYLRTDPVTTDLLTLRDDVATLVDGLNVPAGRYGQIRFVLSGAYIEVEGVGGNLVYATAGYAEAPAQVHGSLHCPSCAQSGLKIGLPSAFEVEEGAESTLLIDFDVSQSFGKEAGNSGKWVMHPSIRAERID